MIGAHQPQGFAHLTQGWKDWFNAPFDVLRYELTRTCFESRPPFPPGDKRRFGSRRDQRPDGVPGVLARIVTPEGFPRGCEVRAGNTSGTTPLKGFLEKIPNQYGQAQRLGVRDRRLPTQETLEPLSKSDPPGWYRVGTPKGRGSKLAAQLAGIGLVTSAGRLGSQTAGAEQ